MRPRFQLSSMNRNIEEWSVTASPHRARAELYVPIVRGSLFGKCASRRQITLIKVRLAVIRRIGFHLLEKFGRRLTIRAAKFEPKADAPFMW